MKVKWNNNLIIIEIFCLALVLLRPYMAFTGAKNGLVLWADIVLPGIFPASFLSCILLNRLNISDKYIKIYIIVCGILSGFPVAAILYSQYCNEKNDNSLDGILAYCNISSPSFICNYIYSFDLIKRISLSRLLAIIYISSLAGIVLCLLDDRFKKTLRSGKNYKPFFILKNGKMAGYRLKPDREKKKQEINVGIIMEQTCINMIKAGGFIVFFSCLSQYLIHFMPEKFILKGIITGLFEITTGINQLCADLVGINKVYGIDSVLFVILINNFGGISTLLQTISVTGSILDIKKYIYHKIIYCCITALVYMFMIYVL